MLSCRRVMAQFTLNALRQELRPDETRFRAVAREIAVGPVSRREKAAKLAAFVGAMS
jgi:hypothetical protein